MNLNQVPLIALGFFNFHFPIDFIGGQLTEAQCFVATRDKVYFSEHCRPFLYQGCRGCCNENEKKSKKKYAYISD